LAGAATAALFFALVLPFEDGSRNRHSDGQSDQAAAKAKTDAKGELRSACAFMEAAGKRKKGSFDKASLLLDLARGLAYCAVPKVRVRPLWRAR